MPLIGTSFRAIALAARGGEAPDVGTGPGPGPDPTPDPDWPQDAVALWLILGQSNAEGYAPFRQDPAQTNAANAVDALTAEERDFHAWLRPSVRASAQTIADGQGLNVGQFPSTGQGLATAVSPRTSGRTWHDPGAATRGIPAGTPSFGPEVALVRHVLSGDAPAAWRDEADPRLFIFKQVEGGQSVDHFRWGGDGQAILLNALRQSGGQNLETLAASKTVLLQGVIFVIGEKDANNDAPTGGTMAATLAPRFADWVRQVRGALGQNLPVALCEIHDALDADKTVANGALATMASTLPNAVVIERTASWTHLGDNIHYDAQGQDALGADAFGHFRDVYGRAGDGLVTGFPFSGLKPWFHVPPVFIRDNGGQMKVAAVPSDTGRIHGWVTAAGTPTPTAQEIVDAIGTAEGFSRPVVADQAIEWFSPGGTFLAGITQDVHFVAVRSDGVEDVLGEVVTVRRGGNVKFNVDLGTENETASSVGIVTKSSFPGVLSWALHAGDRGWMRGEDVEAMAFEPEQAGAINVSAGQNVAFTLSGLSSGTTYTVFATGRRSSDGVAGITQRAVFTTL